MKHETDNSIRCYATPAFECSYLPGKKATNLVIDPNLRLNDILLGALLEQGFRRSGEHIYRPHCEGCQACISIKIPVDKFNPNRSQRRCWRQNQDLSHSSTTAEFNHEQFELYRRYLNVRHTDSEMNNPTREDYMGFLTSAGINTRFHEFRLHNQLLAVSVIDHAPQGLSAVYTFFDPTQTIRSLGTFSILWMIDQARSLHLPWVYLGYWIEACNKMRYKTRFTPCDGYIDDNWQQITPV